MRFTVQFPLDDPDEAEAAVDPVHVAEFAQVAEQAGFDAIAFTEHPAPSAAWLHGAYGHASLDPFAALGFCAALTRRLRLMTYLAVLPYRHPYITAKAATTIDRLSGGRLVLCVGSGYLREEFDALELLFDERATHADRALATLRQAWSQESEEPALRPRPTRVAGPEVWVGGNSARSREAVARHGDGWSPILVDDGLAAELGTRGLGSLERLRRGVDDLHARMMQAGRQNDAVQVQVKGPFSRVRLAGFDRDAHLELLAGLADAGATSVVVHPVADSRKELLDVLCSYGDQVVPAVAATQEVER